MFRTAFKIVNWTGKYKYRMYLGFLCSFFVGISSALPVIIAAYSINAIIMDYNRVEAMQENFAMHMALSVVVAVLLRFMFVQIRSKLLDSLGYEITTEERMKIGSILKRVPLGYFEENKTGDITSIITTELTLLETFITKFVDKLLGGYGMTIAMLVWLMAFNYKAGLIGVVAMLTSMIFLNIIFVNGKKAFKVVMEHQEEMIRHVLEYLRGMSQVKAYDNENAAVSAIKKAFAKSRDTNIKNEVTYMPLKMLHQVSLKLGACGIIYIVTSMAVNGEVTLGFSMLLLMFVFTIFVNIEGANEQALLMSIAEANITNLNRLKEVEFIDADGDAIHLDSYDICFEHVSFAYEKEVVIKDINVVMQEGTTTALVGPSGCGKSTMCHLIARFYDVQSGAISIGGHDLKEFTCDSLLSKISMVFQNVYLFNDTIKNNVLFGNPSATDEEVIEAARKSRCHEFIMNLPEGYETMVGESGATLSGGEKQRISIARAILKDAPIIMLDEATASIDPENEDYIQQAISELTLDKTVITIAHKLSTVRNADNIIVLKEGKILEQGRHEELMITNGLYRKFIDIRKRAEGWTI